MVFPVMQKLICKLNLSVTSMSLPKFIQNWKSKIASRHRAKILRGNATLGNDEGVIIIIITVFHHKYHISRFFLSDLCSKFTSECENQKIFEVTTYFIVCDKPHYVSKRCGRSFNLGILS